MAESVTSGRDVVTFINAIGDAAVATAEKLRAAAESTAAGGGGGDSAGITGTTSGRTTGGVDPLLPKFGTTTVQPLGAGLLISDLKSLGGRT